VNQQNHKVQKILGVCFDGLPFFFIFALATAFTYHFLGPVYSMPLVILSGWCLWFFRDPERAPTQMLEGGILCPADGKIIQIREVDYPYMLEGKALRVCIFMNVFNVHVNRIALDGEIEDLQYRPGKFISAYAEKCSLENEQMGVLLNSNGKKILFVQIAGLIARRIICRLKKGEKVTQGQRFGLIRFGSRVDMYLPLNTRLQVALGDKVQAGQTWIGAI
jgi:phosphatidylserine decarboxylase